MNKTKSYDIDRWLIWRSYKQVAVNKGSSGIDRITVENFDENLKDNLYKLWNRMSSGSYFPKAIKMISIPKGNGGERLLGIPTIEDRIAQGAASIYLQRIMDPKFHEDSYGYRPNKSALDAVGKARERCWKYDWVVDLDIKGFFDNLDHERLMEILERHTSMKWILLYVQRWIEAPEEHMDGRKIERNKGVPQGGSISPMLSNIFMHELFDEWMRGNYPMIPFERYVDDIIIHAKSQKEAEFIKEEIRKRLLDFNLEVHPGKTKIVYCKDSNRKERFPRESFDFLGYTFRIREARRKGGRSFSSFLPGISHTSKKKISSLGRVYIVRKFNIFS